MHPIKFYRFHCFTLGILHPSLYHPHDLFRCILLDSFSTRVSYSLQWTFCLIAYSSSPRQCHSLFSDLISSLRLSGVLENFRVAKLVAIGGPAQRLQAGSGSPATPGGTFHPHPRLLWSDFSRRVLSSRQCDPVWRQAQLTDAIRPSSAAVVESCYAAHLPRLLLYAMKSCAPSACAAHP
jgi:hypothetical protein